MGKLTYSQDSSVVRKIVFERDTLICIKPHHLKTLNLQLSLFSAYKSTCDSIIVHSDEVIKGLRANQDDLTEVIQNDKQIILNMDMQLENCKDDMSARRKIWRRRFIGGASGGVVVGLILGIIIAK